MTPAHQETGPRLTLDSFGRKLNASELGDHSTSAGDGGLAHNPLILAVPLTSDKLTPGPCSRQVPVKLLHWVVEDFVGAGEGYLGGPLGDRGLLSLGCALFSAGLDPVLHFARIP